MKNFRHTLLTLSLTVVSVGCQGPLTEEEALVGEAGAAITVAQETGDVTADAAGAEDEAEVTSNGDAAAELPSAPDDSTGVCDFTAHRARVLARYDANGNGRLDPAERKGLKDDVHARGNHLFAQRFGLGHRVHVMKRLRWVFDVDADGSLSSDERTAMVDALEARCQRLHAKIVARFDVNADGKLDEAEKQAARAAWQARIDAARQEILGRYDTNGNGTLEGEERKNFRAARIAAFVARRAEVVARFDANHDGSLDAAEKLALKQSIIQRIIEGRDEE